MGSHPRLRSRGRPAGPPRGLCLGACGRQKDWHGAAPLSDPPGIPFARPSGGGITARDKLGVILTQAAGDGEKRTDPVEVDGEGPSRSLLTRENRVDTQIDLGEPGGPGQRRYASFPLRLPHGLSNQDKKGSLRRLEGLLVLGGESRVVGIDRRQPPGRGFRGRPARGGDRCPCSRTEDFRQPLSGPENLRTGRER